jgi:drug/metabolite transporter (DMT)-like permease
MSSSAWPAATGTVTFLNPVFGMLWGALFLAETISSTFLVGALLVSVSLLLIFDVRLPAGFRRAAVAAVPAEADE